MTRIISGEHGGRRIEVPPSGTRPTSDRVREALFSKLQHGGDVDGARVLDLFAGSGALALEALSRGAAEAVLVEFARAAQNICRANAATLGMGGRVTVVGARVEKFLSRTPASQQFDLVFADPPYDLPDPGAMLAALVDGRWLAPEAMVVLERSSRSPEPQWPTELDLIDSRKYGESTVYFARFSVSV